MSKVIQPFGELAKEITIKADTKGLVIVEAYNVVPVVKRGFRPQSEKLPMDAREMVIALLKVVMDYSSVIFASMGTGVLNHGEANKDDDYSGKSG